MKKIFSVLIVVMLSIFLVFAHGTEEDELAEIQEGKELVENKVSCDQLNDEQLEAIGEYVMEQMHPGEQHETMHQHMGMDTDEELHDQMHVNMAKMMYCSGNKTGMMMPMNMMRMMMGSGGMMESNGGRNMMQTQMGAQMGDGMMQGGMMGSTTAPGTMGWSMWLWNIVWFLFWIGVIALVVWLIYKYLIKQPVTTNPLETLKQRYARGEITKKEFEAMKQDIMKR